MSYQKLTALLALVAALSLPLFSQTFRGGVAGTVTDASGAAIAGASVKLLGTDTGLTRSVASGNGGEFSFTDLPLGRYSVTVTDAGFQKTEINNIGVEPGKTFNLAAKLEVASQATSVQVEASAVAIETSSSTLTSVIPNKVITDVPLNGRDFTKLLQLNPGVNAAGSLNGTRTNSINWQIDGADNNDQWHNSAAVNQGGVSGVAGTLLPIDAIDQFSLQSNSDAESGRNGGGVLNLVIKSGTNAYHGSLYYFNRNEFLAARNYFVSPTARVQKFRNNQPGGSLGGPIWKNRTFFFLTYEQQNLRTGNTAQGTTPSAAWVNQASSLLAARGVAINPVSLRLINAYWPANSLVGAATQNNFFSNADALSDSYNGIVKLDHIFNERNNISARYFGGTGAQTANAGSVIPFYYQVAPSRMHNFSVVYNTVISPRFVGQTTVGVNYFKQTFNDANTGTDANTLGLNTGVTNPFLFGAPNISISGFDSTGVTAPLGRIDTTGSMGQTFTYTAGSHQLRFGAEYRRARFDVFYQRNGRGTFAFNGSQGPNGGTDSWGTAAFVGGPANASLNALADFLSGRLATNQASIGYGDRQRNYYLNSTSGFIQDSWKVNPNLTLNFGVNYIFQGPLSDPTNRISTFLPSQGGITYVGQGITTLYPRDWNNFAPRFGFAYKPMKSNRVVVRGGYGLFYQVPNVNYFGDSSAGNGGATGVLANPGGAAPVYSLANQSPFTIQNGAPIFGSSTFPTGPFGLFSVNQNFLTGYVHNYNLNTQVQLSSSSVLEIGYTGTLSRKLPVTLDINQQPIGSTIRPYRSTFPNFATINEVQSVGNGYYNGASVSLRSTNFHGVNTKLNYTFGHARDGLSAARSTIPQNSYCLRCDYSDSDFDVRHSFAGYIGYDIPSPERFKAILGGWQLNSLLSFSSGRAFTVNAGRNTSGTGENKDRAQLVGDPYANVPADIANRAIYWFNPAAFGFPANATYGNLGRNSLRGPGITQVDFSVFKNNIITERMRVQLRLDMFNLFNARILAPPTGSVASSGNGQITQTLDSYNGAPGLGTGAARNVQLGVKLIF